MASIGVAWGKATPCSGASTHPAGPTGWCARQTPQDCIGPNWLCCDRERFLLHGWLEAHMQGMMQGMMQGHVVPHKTEGVLL